MPPCLFLTTNSSVVKRRCSYAYFEDIWKVNQTINHTCRSVTVRICDVESTVDIRCKITCNYSDIESYCMNGEGWGFFPIHIRYCNLFYYVLINNEINITVDICTRHVRFWHPRNIRDVTTTESWYPSQQCVDRFTVCK